MKTDEEVLEASVSAKSIKIGAKQVVTETPTFARACALNSDKHDMIPVRCSFYCVAVRILSSKRSKLQKQQGHRQSNSRVDIPPGQFLSKSQRVNDLSSVGWWDFSALNRDRYVSRGKCVH